MRGIRGAICARANTREAIAEATQTLLREIVERNRLKGNAIVSVFFTMTPDLDAEYPAYAARDMGWAEVPMLGAVETPVPGAPKRVIRALVLARGSAAPRHVYLGRASRMRPDLTEPGDAQRWDGLEAAGQPRGELGRLLVVGLGLIGGSLAGAARRSGLFREVVGADVDAAAQARARARGLVDSVAESESEAMREVDLIVLAAPLEDLPGLVRRVGQAAHEGAIVTDVGSLKVPVVRAMDELPPGIRAVGGHPMAGSERDGVEGADASLFEGAPWALVPTRRTDGTALERVRRMVIGLGARPVVLDATEHDRALTFTSHLPALLACACARLAGRAAESLPAIRALVGPAFRDATRVAAAGVRLTADLLGSDPERLAHATDGLITALRELVAAAGRRDDLESAISEARELRTRLVPSATEIRP